MKSNHKRILALLMAFALILQYSFSASFLSVYAEGEGEQTEVTQSEAKAAADPAPAPEPEPEPAPAPVAEENSEPAPAPAAAEDAPAVSEEPEDTAKDEQAAEENSGAETSEAVTEEQTEGTEAAAEEALPEEEAIEEEEEVKYPADTFKGSAGGVSVVINAPEGALPEGTKLTVTPVAASEVQDAVEAAIGGEASSIKAVDITFSYKGKEIEPKKAVKVHMNASGMANEANQSVVHIADSGAASVVTEAVSNGNATFNSKDFSIYIVVGEDKPTPEENAVATYQFYADDKLVQTQYIKTGDKITDPGNLAVGADEANTVFKGWFIGDTPVDFDSTQTVDETKTVRVDAKIQRTYYVTFWGEKDAEGNRGIIAVKSVTVEGTASGEVEIDDVTVTPKADTSAFKGWSESATGTETISGDSIEVSGRKDLYAVVVNAHWLHFYENEGDDSDSDATYTGPVFIAETDLRSSKKPENPTREGYTFGGWYLDEACSEGKEFDWTATGLDEDTDLYAKWIPGEASLTIVIWKQKVTDSKEAADADKTYDFESSADWTGTTGETVNLDDFNMYKDLEYTGFHYRTMEASTAKVKADGTTVVNVYYDRNLLTIRLVDGSHTEYVEATDNNGTQYGLVDGNYVRLDRRGNTWSYSESGTYDGTYYHQVYGNNGTQYGLVNGSLVQLTRRNNRWYANGERYNGDRYSEGQGEWYETTYGVVNGALTALSYDFWTGDYTYSITHTYTGTRYKMATVPTEKVMTGLYGQTLAQNGYTWPTEEGSGWYQNPNEGGTRLTFLDTFKFEGLSGTSDENKTLTQYKGDFSGTQTIRFYKEGLDGNWNEANVVYASNRSSFTVTEKYEGFKAVSYKNGQGNWHDVSAGDTIREVNNLQIRFQRQKYDLTFISEGKEVGKQEEIPYEKEISGYKIADPTKAHYDFAGWYEDISLQQEVDWSSKMPAANKVVYAKWTPKQYHVSLDPNGGDFKNAQKGEFDVPLDTILDKTSLTINIEKEKHELVGWFDKTSGEAYGYGKIEDNVSLIAKWRYPGQVQIIYDARSHGSGAPEDNYMYATDSSVVLGAPPATVDEGWAFVGWEVAGKKYYTNNTFDITEDIIEDYNEETKTGKVTVKAIYADLTSGPFAKTSITYKANGGEGDDVVVNKSPSDSTKDLLVNEKVTAKSDTDCGFTYEGYKFTGWNTDKGGNGLAVAAGDSIAADMLSRDGNTDANTLYAQWCRVYTVTFDPDDGAPDPEDQKVESGKTATKPDDPTKDNNDFLGWFEVGEDGTLADEAFDFSTKITKDTNLKAKWDPKTVTVTFDANGHGTAPAAQTVNKGAKATEPTDPTEAGFTFGGWYTEAACGDDKKFDFDTPVNADITLYAKWTAQDIGYKVEFYYQEDGEYPETATSTDDRTGKTDAKVEVTADDKKPTKDGYVIDEDKSDAWSGTVTADGSLVLKVYFKQQFTVTFDANGHGTAPDAQTVDAGKTASKPDDPKVDGYTFGGWFTEADCTNEYDFSTTVMEDKTLYAKWTESETETADITYDLNGGTYNDSTANIVETHEVGEVIKIHAAPTRDGYVFVEWRGSSYQPGDSYTVEGDHTFTAIWEAANTDTEDEDTPDNGDKSDKKSDKKTDSSKGVKTGDDSDIMGLIALMSVSAAGLIAMYFRRRREED